MARKAPSNLKSEQKEFVKLFNSLSDRHSSWHVWSDFVEMTAISIQNTIESFKPTLQFEKREKRYIDIISQYTPDEQNVFPKMLVTMTDAMEANQEQDFLGEMFMALELGNHWKGQFFTPYNICRAMAEMIQGDEIKRLVEEEGYASVNDPACGAGALLIAARNAFSAKGIGSDQVLFVAQDIDRVAGLMCFNQLSLFGCAGYVVIADTLCNPICGDTPLFPVFNENHDVWYTPMWYSDIWMMRRFFHATDRRNAKPAESAAETQKIAPHAVETQRSERPEPVEEPPAPSEPQIAVGEQLILF